MCNCKQQEFELIPELETAVKNYDNEYEHEYEAGRGRTAGASKTPVYVKKFSGPAAECRTALTRAGKTEAQALAIINAQIDTAIKMLRFAAHQLKRANRTKQTNQIFQRIFRVTPAFVPTWLKQTSTIRDRGDVVATRCSRVADLLASGRIRYFCSITAANCPDCSNNNDFACSSWGDESVAPNNSNVICLGTQFWDDMKNGRINSMLAVLMHEPFHIYYGIYVTEHSQTRSVGKFGGIYCIVQFVFELNRYTHPKLFSDRCRDTAVRS